MSWQQRQRSGLVGVGSTLLPERIEAFEFLRALGCFLVVLEHVFLPASIVDYLHHSWCFSFGGLGIGIFTFVSGYLIARSLEGRPIGDYASSRFWRIYPTYLSVLAIAWAVYTVIGYSRLVPTEELTPRGLWAQAFFVRDILNMYNPLISGDWTLMYEVQFYLFAGISWWVYLRSGSVRWLFVAYLALIIMSYIFLSALSYQYLHGQAAMQRTGGALFCFAGMVFFLYRNGRIVPHGPAIIVGIWLLGALAFCYFFGKFEYAYLQVSITQLIAIGIAVACITQNFPAKPKKLVTFIADISFPLYLLHQTFGTVGLSTMLQVDFGLWTIVDRALTFISIILPMSILLHRFVEGPGMRLGRLRRESRRIQAEVARSS